MDKKTAITFAQETEVLASRWPPLLKRLSRATVSGELEDDSQHDDLFSAATLLLEQGHDLYRRAYETLTCGTSNDAVCSPATGSTGDTSHSPFALLLSDFLVHLSSQECIIADWRENYALLTADTIRIYCHHIISGASIPAEALNRVLESL